MILSTQFLTPRHLLCLKSRSVELLTLDFLQEVHDSSVPETSQTLAGHALYSRGQRQPPLIQHELPNKSMNLRGAVFSLPKIVHQQDGVSSIGVTFLAYDVLRGLFHYSVETQFSCVNDKHSSVLSSPFEGANSLPCPMDVTVTLLAAHHMAQLVRVTDVIPGPHRFSRGGFTPGSRGFISACALGDQGKRGIWVERQRSSMGRSIFGFSTGNYFKDDKPLTGSDRPGYLTDGEIQGKRIFEVVNSYDLRGEL